jgi:hypothetical protein
LQSLVVAGRGCAGKRTRNEWPAVRPSLVFCLQVPKFRCMSFSTRKSGYST